MSDDVLFPPVPVCTRCALLEQRPLRKPKFQRLQPAVTKTHKPPSRSGARGFQNCTFPLRSGSPSPCHYRPGAPSWMRAPCGAAPAAPRTASCQRDGRQLPACGWTRARASAARRSFIRAMRRGARRGAPPGERARRLGGGEGFGPSAFLANWPLFLSSTERKSTKLLALSRVGHSLAGERACKRFGE